MRVFFVARLSAVADLGVPLRDAAQQMRLGGPISRSAIPEIERQLALALPPA